MNKKFNIIIISLVLAFVLAFSACTDGSTSSNGKTDGKSTTISDDAKLYDGGIHNYSVEKTSDYLIKNGNTDYKILLTSDVADKVYDSALDMKTIIKQATGARLDIIYDNIEFTGNVISVGNTTLAQSNNISATSDMKEMGYGIKTIGKNVFIYGNTIHALTCGIYGFLEAQFNFENFTDEYYYIDETDTVNLFNLDIKEIPDLGYTEVGSGFINTDLGTYRSKLIDRSDYIQAYRTVHTYDRYFPESTYNDKENNPDTYHPLWYATGANQLCLTAHGNKEERTALVNEVANIFIGYLKEDLSKNIFNFGQNDEFTWCGCDACNKSYTKYGSNAAVVIQLLNEVCEIIDEWMESEDGAAYKRDYFISFLAYQKTLSAPKLVDDSVKCCKHLSAMFCPYHMDLQNSLYDEVNANFLQLFESWREISPNFSYFGYFYRGGSFLHFYDCFEIMREVFVYLAESNSRVFYTETPAEQRGSAFHALRTYVITKLTWNVNLDIDELINNFCERFYLDAADTMRNIFYAERTWYNVKREELTTSSGFYSNDLMDKKYWPKNLLLTWYESTNDAIDEISYLKKTDPELYDTIYHHITLERLSFEYMLVSMYENELSADFVYTLKVQAIQDAEENYVQQFNLSTLISDIFGSWGV